MPSRPKSAPKFPGFAFPLSSFRSLLTLPIPKGKGILGIASEQLAWCPQDYLAKARILVRAWLASHSVRHATAAISMDSTVAYENVYDSRLHLGRLTTSQVALDHGCCFTAGPSPANRQQRVAKEPLNCTRVQATALSRCNDRRCGKQRSIPKLRGTCRLISPRLKPGALRRNLVNSARTIGLKLGSSRISTRYSALSE